MTTKGTRVGLAVLSTILFTTAACTLVATVALGWLYGTKTDSDGFVWDGTVSISTDSYAITSTELDFGSVPEELFPTGLVGTFRLHAESETGSPVFIGVAPADEVDEYLAEVEHTSVLQFGGRRIAYSEHDGSEIPQPPADLDIWTASSNGEGRQTLEWEPETGSWTLVIMNASADPGVDVAALVSFNTPWLFFGLIICGLLTLLFGGLAIVTAIPVWRQSATAETTEPAPEPAPLAR